MYRLAIDRAYRRQGIAGRLLSEAETWLKSQVVKRVGAVLEKDHPWVTGFWDSTEFYLEPLDIRYVRDL
ncbi:MAG: GNAT family N-acetyltransferase [SAR202 cluster bacterium]|nr:GNAT family N-acetyltransferase [SAR202 cluster bacterium]